VEIGSPFFAMFKLLSKRGAYLRGAERVEGTRLDRQTNVLGRAELNGNASALWDWRKHLRPRPLERQRELAGIRDSANKQGD